MARGGVKSRIRSCVTCRSPLAHSPLATRHLLLATPMSEHFRRLERMYHAAPINEYFQPKLHIPEAGVAELTSRDSA